MKTADTTSLRDREQKSTDFKNRMVEAAGGWGSIQGEPAGPAVGFLRWITGRHAITWRNRQERSGHIMPCWAQRARILPRVPGGQAQNNEQKQGRKSSTLLGFTG